jgi:phosphate uptake regulator
MHEVIEKTIQQIGGKSLGVLIPKKWAHRLGIKKGTKIILVETETYIEIKLSNNEYYRYPF